MKEKKDLNVKVKREAQKCLRQLLFADWMDDLLLPLLLISCK